MRVALLVVVGLTFGAAGCSHSTVAPHTARPTDSPPPAPTVLKADGVLKFDSDGTLQLGGRISGTVFVNKRLQELDLAVPTVMDAVGAKTEFALLVTNSSRILDRSGRPVPRSDMRTFLVDGPRGPRYWGPWIAEVRMQNAGLLLVELRPVARQTSHLVCQNMFAPAVDGTVKLTGAWIGSGSASSNMLAPLKLHEVDLEVPFVIDGVTAKAQFALRITDKSTVLDRSGRVVPRARQDNALADNLLVATAVMLNQRFAVVQLRVLGSADAYPWL